MWRLRGTRSPNGRAAKSAAHRKHAEWIPERITAWAGQTGPHTRAFAEAILAERKHPEHGYRSCLGIMRLAKRCGAERIEAACHRALVVGARSYTRVESILQGCGSFTSTLDGSSFDRLHELEARPASRRGPRVRNLTIGVA